MVLLFLIFLILKIDRIAVEFESVKYLENITFTFKLDVNNHQFILHFEEAFFNLYQILC